MRFPRFAYCDIDPKNSHEGMNLGGNTNNSFENYQFINKGRNNFCPTQFDNKASTIK